MRKWNEYWIYKAALAFTTGGFSMLKVRSNSIWI